MSAFVHIPRSAVLALQSVQILAAHPDETLTTRDIACALGVSEHHLAKVHMLLAHAGLLQAVRGPHGGVRLARDPNDVSLLDVYEMLEGPLQPVHCPLGQGRCKHDCCRLGELIVRVEVMTRDFLSGTTVAAFAAQANS